MKFITGTYAIMSFGIVSLFLVMYFVSGLEFCLIPMCMVIYDFIKSLRMRRQPGQVHFSIERINLAPVRQIEVEEEFIKEWEFKV